MSLFDDASLVLIPDGAKDGTLYSVKPTDGTGDFTFTRGSNLAATRVDENGLIEKGRENLLLQSNQFDTTWVLNNASLTSGQSGYDGTNDAWLLESTSTAFSLYQDYSQSGVSTFSIYAKQGTSTSFGIDIFTSASTNAQFFNLSDGSLGSSTGSVISANIIDIGNGWYRCSVTTNNTGTVYYARITNGVGNTYIQDAQLEVGLVATDYIETGATTAQAGILEDLPRIDYSGGASCPALLLEPQRTNIYTHSEYLSNFDGNETFNAAISPEGVSNATKLTKTSASDQFLQVFWTGATISPSTDYTISLFVKYSGDDVNIRYEQNSGLDWGFGWFAEFLVRSSGVTASTTSNCTSDIEDYGDGWYRILVFVTSDASATPTSPSNLLRVIGASGEELLVYGAQLEEGSYPTSYIPTYGSSVTRSADSCVKTGISSLIGQTEGTLFFEGSILDTSSVNRALGVSDGTGNNRIFINLTPTLEVRIIASGTATGVFNGASVPANTIFKVALAYANNDMTIYYNGSLVGTDSSVTVPACTDFRFDSGGGTSNFLGNVNQALLFPTRLSNTELAALTTI